MALGVLFAKGGAMLRWIIGFWVFVVSASVGLAEGPRAQSYLPESRPLIERDVDFFGGDLRCQLGGAQRSIHGSFFVCRQNFRATTCQVATSMSFGPITY